MDRNAMNDSNPLSESCESERPWNSAIAGLSHPRPRKQYVTDKYRQRRICE